MYLSYVHKSKYLHWIKVKTKWYNMFILWIKSKSTKLVILVVKLSKKGGGARHKTTKVRLKNPQFFSYKYYFCIMMWMWQPSLKNLLNKLFRSIKLLLNHRKWLKTLQCTCEYEPILQDKVWMLHYLMCKIDKL